MIAGEINNSNLYRKVKGISGLSPVDFIILPVAAKVTLFLLFEHFLRQ
jgi:hypothetical protein